MQPDRPVIAVVDDDESVRRALKRFIRSLSYAAADFSSGETFLGSLSEGKPRCVLVDLQMPGLSGLDVLMELRTRNVEVPVIIITANERTEMRELCLDAGAVAYLTKPLDIDALTSAIESAAAV